MKLAQIAFRNISRNRRRSILSGSAIAIASLAMVMLFGFIGGIVHDMEENAQKLLSGTVRIRDKEFTKNERLYPMHLYIKDSEAIADLLEKQNGVVNYSERISFPGRIYRDDSNINIQGVGVDFSRETSYQNLQTFDPDTPRKKFQPPPKGVIGTLPENGKNQALMGVDMAEKYGYKIGDKITIMSNTAARGTNAFTVQITGLVRFPLDQLNNITVMIPLDRARYFLKMPQGATEFFVAGSGEIKPKELASNIKESISTLGRDDIEVTPWTEITIAYSSMQMAQTVYNVFGIFFFLLGATVIVNTTMMVIFERMREIGTMAAMGLTGKELIRLFFLEALFISLIGSFIGVLLGSGLTTLLHYVGIPLGAAMDGVDFEMSSVLYPLLQLKDVIVVFVLSVLVSSAATFFPSRRSAKIQPVEALRYV